MRSRPRAIAQVLQETISALTVPAPFTIEGLCRALSDHRGRPIRLVPMSSLGLPYPPPTSGAWIAGPTTDLVFYDDTTSELHALNSQLHEIGHMLLGHGALDALDEVSLSLLNRLMPDLDPTIVRRSVRSVRCRSQPTGSIELQDADEQDAELLGTLLWRQYAATSRWDAGQQPHVPATRVITRLVATLRARLGLSRLGAP